VEEVSRRLCERGHEVRIFGRAGYCDAQAPWKGAHLTPLRNWGGVPGWSTAAHCVEASLACLADPPDLIHFHATGPAACAWLARLGSVPAVVTFHGRDWMRRRWGVVARAALRTSEALAVRAARRVVAVSKPLAATLEKRWRIPVRCIPNGVTPGPRLPPPPESAPVSVLYLGRLVEEKGVHHLVRAFASLRQDVRLWIAGPGDGRDTYAQHVRTLAAGDSRVQFLGALDAQERDRRLAECTLFVLPSELEGMSLAILEAMAAGRAVLASDIAENRWLLNSGGDGTTAGFLFRSGDAHDLACRMNEILSRPDLLREAGDAGRKRVRQLFDWDRCVDDLERTYADALEETL
jgi:glycosyltransferase involved in cell wall biosynthesis